MKFLEHEIDGGEEYNMTKRELTELVNRYLSEIRSGRRILEARPFKIEKTEGRNTFKIVHSSGAEVNFATAWGRVEALDYREYEAYPMRETDRYYA